MSKVHRIGIICEDESDFLAIKELIKRITNVGNLSYKAKHNNGCTHIKSKGARWAQELFDNDCQLLVVFHDGDREDYDELFKLLEKTFSATPFKNQYICIPVEELEAWFLSDPEMLKSFFRLHRQIKPASNPESMSDPKGWLRKQVRLCSDGEATYLNTDHNEKLARNVSLETLNAKCGTFKAFRDFINMHQYR